MFQKGPIHLRGFLYNDVDNRWNWFSPFNYKGRVSIDMQIKWRKHPVEHNTI